MHQMHPDEEQIQRALHHELGPGAEGAVNDHLSTCRECQSRLTEARREEAWVLDRLGALDHTAPSLTANSIFNRGARQGPAWARVAAGVVLALGLAGLAYAAPGSPLPGAIRRLFHLVPPASQPSTERVIGRPSQESPAGIAVAPGDRLTVEFATSKTPDTVVVSLTDGTELVARALGAPATFSTDADHLVIQHAGGSVSFEIVVPRGAPWVSLRAGNRQLWLKAHGRILSRATPDREGRYVLPLSQKLDSPAP